MTAILDTGLHVEHSGGITRLTLDRPEARNALTRQLCVALRESLSAAAGDASVRALVITGSGGSFASGADIAELDRLRADPEQLLAAYRELRATQEQLHEFPMPTVAVVDGYCIGAGLSLALACDLAVASERSVFSAPPLRMGLLYSDSEICRLLHRIGPARTRDLLYTGRRVEAAEALQLGLIDRVWPAERLLERLHALMASMAGSAPMALRSFKRQTLRLERLSSERSPAGDSAAERALFEPEAIEAMRAFLERRQPDFQD